MKLFVISKTYNNFQAFKITSTPSLGNLDLELYQKMPLFLGRAEFQAC